jgi:hypothetical protein
MSDKNYDWPLSSKSYRKSAATDAQPRSTSRRARVTTSMPSARRWCALLGAAGWLRQRGGGTHEGAVEVID